MSDYDDSSNESFDTEPEHEFKGNLIILYDIYALIIGLAKPTEY